MGLWDDDDKAAEIKEGQHVGKIENVSLDETKDDPKILIRFRIQEGEAKGEALFLNLTFKDTTRKFVRWQMEKLGIFGSVEDAKDYNDTARKALDVLGKIEQSEQLYLLNVTDRQWQGRIYKNVVVEDPINAGDWTAAQNAKRQKIMDEKAMENDDFGF